MSAMSAPERAQFLSRVLGYERIRAAQDRLREKRSALRARLDALRASLGDPAELDAAETKARERVAAAASAEAAADAAWRELERSSPRPGRAPSGCGSFATPISRSRRSSACPITS